MSKGESVTSGLAISGIGVAMILMGFHSLLAGGIATLGVVIALVAIFQPDGLVVSTRKRLLRAAQAVLDLSAVATTDEEFQNAFFDLESEVAALRDFVRTRYALEREYRLGRELYRREEAADFAAALRELAAQIR